jgi:preprotein translocase SecE subunit
MAVGVVRSPAWGSRMVATWRGIPAGYRSVIAEMRRVTWPDLLHVRQMAVGVIALSLFIGGLIAAMDFTFQQVLVKWIPQLFAGR